MLVDTLKIDAVVGNRCRELASSGSEIRRTFQLGLDYKRRFPNADLIDLSLGNPDVEPPSEVRESLLALLSHEKAGMHRYMDNAGFPETRAFLAAEISKSEQVSLSENSVFMTCGAAGGLQIILRAILDPGDEVIVFAPYFVEYVPYVANLGGKVVVVPCNDRHEPEPSALQEALTRRTKALILNSPNNPTGVVYSQSLVRRIVEVLKGYNEKTGSVVQVISDEPYSRLLFSGQKHFSILKEYGPSWLVRSHSKDLGLAGERIGYIVTGQAFPTDQIMAALRNAARITGFVNAPALMQRLLPLVYHASVHIGEYERRVAKFVELMKAGGISIVPPGGSFFAFPQSPVTDDREFCGRLLDFGVLAVPGTGFGRPGYFRVSLTQPFERIEEAAQRILKACEAI